jgi:hypothetical protein
MNNQERRLVALETAEGDQAPLVVWKGDLVPPNPTNRPLLSIGWIEDNNGDKERTT